MSDIGDAYAVADAVSRPLQEHELAGSRIGEIAPGFFVAARR